MVHACRRSKMFVYYSVFQQNKMQFGNKKEYAYFVKQNTSIAY